jgi:hypothetical protein
MDRRTRAAWDFQERKCLVARLDAHSWRRSHRTTATPTYGLTPFSPEAGSSRIKPNQGASKKIEPSAPQNPGQLPLIHQSNNPSIQSAADSSPIKPNQGPQEKLAAPQIAIQVSNLLVPAQEPG